MELLKATCLIGFQATLYYNVGGLTMVHGFYLVCYCQFHPRVSHIISQHRILIKNH